MEESKGEVVEMDTLVQDEIAMKDEQERILTLESLLHDEEATSMSRVWLTFASPALEGHFQQEVICSPEQTAHMQRGIAAMCALEAIMLVVHFAQLGLQTQPLGLSLRLALFAAQLLLTVQTARVGHPTAETRFSKHTTAVVCCFMGLHALQALVVPLETPFVTYFQPSMVLWHVLPIVILFNFMHWRFVQSVVVAHAVGGVYLIAALVSLILSLVGLTQQSVVTTNSVTASLSIDVLSAFGGVLGVLGLGSYLSYHYEAVLRKSWLIAKLLDDENAKSEAFLTRLLPPSVIDQLLNGNLLVADQFDHVSVLFLVVSDFGNLASSVTALELVELLNDLYSELDFLTEEHDVFKVETIGEVYMVCSGAPESLHANVTEPLVHLSVAMQQMVNDFPVPANTKALQVQIGIHTGPLVAGVLGPKLPRYRLFGDTVNTASRMCSHCPPGRVQLSKTAYEDVKECSGVSLQSRGQMDIKGKGVMETWFVRQDAHDTHSTPTSPLRDTRMPVVDAEDIRLSVRASGGLNISDDEDEDDGVDNEDTMHGDGDGEEGEDGEDGVQEKVNVSTSASQSPSATLMGMTNRETNTLRATRSPMRLRSPGRRATARGPGLALDPLPEDQVADHLRTASPGDLGLRRVGTRQRTADSSSKAARSSSSSSLSSGLSLSLAELAAMRTDNTRALGVSSSAIDLFERNSNRAATGEGGKPGVPAWGNGQFSATSFFAHSSAHLPAQLKHQHTMSHIDTSSLTGHKRTRKQPRNQHHYKTQLDLLGSGSGLTRTDRSISGGIQAHDSTSPRGQIGGVVGNRASRSTSGSVLEDVRSMVEADKAQRQARAKANPTVATIAEEEEGEEDGAMEETKTGNTTTGQDDEQLEDKAEEANTNSEGDVHAEAGVEEEQEEQEEVEEEDLEEVEVGTPMNRVTLLFEDPELEVFFGEYKVNLVLRQVRAGFLIASVATVGYILVEVLDTTTANTNAGGLSVATWGRLLLLAVCLGNLALTYTSVFTHHAQRVLFGGLFAMGAILGTLTLLDNLFNPIVYGMFVVFCFSVMHLNYLYGMVLSLLGMVIFVFSPIAARYVAQVLLCLLSVACVCAYGSWYVERQMREDFWQQYVFVNTHRKTEMLIQNLLPQPIMMQLKTGLQVVADECYNVPVMFCDVAGFTELSAQISAEQLVTLLNEVYSAFDQLVDKHDLYKVETIGDCYMVAGHLFHTDEKTGDITRYEHVAPAAPSRKRIRSYSSVSSDLLKEEMARDRNDSLKRRSMHAGDLWYLRATESMVQLAIDMLDTIRKIRDPMGRPLNVRVGIHLCDKVVAGCVGRKMPRYHLFGKAIHVAESMEHNGIRGMIQLSQEAMSVVASNSDFEWVARGDEHDGLPGAKSRADIAETKTFLVGAKGFRKRLDEMVRAHERRVSRSKE